MKARSRVTHSSYGFAKASLDDTEPFCAEKRNSPSTARPALEPPRGIPRRSKLWTACCTGVPCHRRT